MLKEKFYDFIDIVLILKWQTQNLKALHLFVSTCNVHESDTCVKTINNWEKYI